MGKAIKDHSKKAAKNRVKKCRSWKKIKSVHEQHVYELVHSINELLFEKVCDDADQENIDDEDEDNCAGIDKSI